jgi:hypothetical protein
MMSARELSLSDTARDHAQVRACVHKHERRSADPRNAGGVMVVFGTSLYKVDVRR